MNFQYSNLLQCGDKKMLRKFRNKKISKGKMIEWQIDGEKNSYNNIGGHNNEIKCVHTHGTRKMSWVMTQMGM